MNLYEVKEKLLDHLREYGFKDLDKAYSIIKGLLDQAPDLPKAIHTIIDACKESFNADKCLLNFSRFIDNSFSPYSQIKEIAGNELVLQILKTVFGSSQFLSSILIIDSSILEWLFEGGLLYDYSEDELKAETIRIDENFQSEDAFLNAINHFKLRHILLIAIRELFGKANIRETTNKLSILYDTILQAVYRRTIRDYLGCEMAVISLGKLGGNEINFSSDLDLIFVSDRKSERLQDLGRKFISCLTESTSRGYLFRIDMRLRPEGTLSPIVTDFDYLKNYLSNRARTWERQAYIRARFSAGDPEIGQRTIDLIENFVFKSTLTIEDIRSIIFIKNEIDHSTANNPVGNVKKGRGGIRDIEFIVQAFQLIYGKVIPELRRANIFYGLEILYHYGFINDEAYQTLNVAYNLLRRTEHYLQLYENRQVFDLPQIPEQLDQLSRMLGYKNRQEFLEYYADIREKVRVVFSEVFTRVFGEGEIAPISEIVMNPEIEEKTGLALLSKYEFQDPRSIFEYLRYLSSLSPGIQLGLSLALSTILAGVKDNPNPDKKMFNLFAVIQAYGAVATFLKLIRYDHQFRNIFLEAIAESDYLTEILKEFPGIIDLFIDPQGLEISDDLNQWYQSILSIYEGKLMPSLYQLKSSVFFKTAIREFLGAIDYRQAGDLLSSMIDFAIEQAANALQTPDIHSFSILAFGRLGSRELTFGSDADVVFIYHDHLENKSNYNQFFIKLIKFLKPIIVLDTRLRPFGRNSSLIISESDFLDYLQNYAQFWEKPAYMKSRLVLSSSDQAERLRNHIRRFVLSGTPADDLPQILKLRQKVHQAYSRPDQFNIKKDAGGLMDIDFIVFREIRKHKMSMFSNSTYENLKSFGMNKMANIYSFYRSLENMLRMFDPNTGSIIILKDTKILEWIARKLKIKGANELLTIIDEYKNAVITAVEKN